MGKQPYFVPPKIAVKSSFLMSDRIGNRKLISDAGCRRGTLRMSPSAWTDTIGNIIYNIVVFRRAYTADLITNQLIFSNKLI